MIKLQISDTYFIIKIYYVFKKENGIISTVLKMAIYNLQFVLLQFYSLLISHHILNK